MFRQFDIDYFQVTIDDSVIERPKYMSPKEWLEFWEQFDGETVEFKVSQAYDEGFKQAENEHESELEDLKKFCSGELDHLLKQVEQLMDDRELTNEERIEALAVWVDTSRNGIWRS